MRKLLLATVAGLGAWGAIVSDAAAQSAPFAPTYTGGTSSPAAAKPTPGTVVVRLNGRVRFYAFGAFDGDADNNASGSATGTVNAAGNGTLTGTNKQANYGFAEYARLYPGFDGVAANGLKYGASIEIRQDQSSGAGGGLFGSVSGQNRQRSGLYFRRIWGYLGTDTIGTVRLGSTDQPTSLYLTGNFENFNDGGWNGDLPGLISSNIAPAWPFADVGSYYTTNKIVYLSPQILGFDLGASFEPSTANVNLNNNCGAGSGVGTNFINPDGSFTPAAGAGGQSVSGPGCDRLSSSPFNSESARRRNTFDVLLRYRGSFGPVGVAVTGAYVTGSHVLDNQSGVPYNNNPISGATIRRNYNGLGVGDFGAALTFAGLSVGGHYQTGQYNGGMGTLLAQGFQDSNAWLAGASYTFGPVIVGASYFVSESAGDYNNAFFGRQRKEQGIAAGGTYALAPGVSIFLSALYGERKQNGFNFVTAQGVTATSPGGNAFNNKVISSAVSLGTAFSW